MSKTLGNYHVRGQHLSGQEMGEVIETTEFDVGRHCTGVTYDGKTVGSLWVKGEDPIDDLSITHIEGDEIMLSMMHTTSLDNWEKLLEDALNHVRQLKKGEQL